VVDTHAHRLFTQLSLIYFLSVIENDTESPARLSTDYEDVDSDAFSLQSTESIQDVDSLLYYATHFWSDHFRLARIECFHAPEWILTKRLFDPVSHCTFFRICSVGQNYTNGERVSKPGDRLYHASFLGFTELVEWLMQEGENPNASSGAAYTYPVIAAAAQGHEAVIGLLLDSGGEIGARDIKFNCTALYFAVRHGHEATSRLLLNRGAALNVGFEFTTPLHEAAAHGHESVVRMLIQAGEDVNRQGGEYGYPLQAASSYGNQSIVQLLLENGALINAEGGVYGSALQAAVCFGDEVVRLLLQNGADVNAKGGYYGSPLQGAAITCNADMVRLLLESGADINAEGSIFGSALQSAAYSGHVEIVQLLLEKGADVNAEGGKCGCALQAVATNNRIPWSGRVREDCMEVARLLLDNGANVNAKGGEYGSALRAAKEHGFEDMIRLLLENGAQD